jgi:hypothetical protein
MSTPLANVKTPGSLPKKGPCGTLLINTQLLCISSSYSFFRSYSDYSVNAYDRHGKTKFKNSDLDSSGRFVEDGFEIWESERLGEEEIWSRSP